MYLDFDEIEAHGSNISNDEPTPVPVYAISDVHSDYAENLAFIQQLEPRPDSVVLTSHT